MNLQALKSNLTSVMPILNANLGAAHALYMAGDLAAGAYGIVRGRHEIAVAVLARDDLAAEDGFKACALLAVDLRAAVKDMADPVAAQVLVDGWWQCYRDAGFTEVHKLFDAPMLPAGAVRM